MHSERPRTVYCKYCGMESANLTMCEWCGREPARATETTTPTREISTPSYFSAYDAAYKLDDILAYETEDATKETLFDFLTYCAFLIFLGLGLIGWHYGGIYLLITMGGIFAAGALLHQLRLIPDFEDVWDSIDIPLMFMLVLFVPASLVYLGYIVYAVTKPQSDRTVVRLLAPCFMGLLTLIVVAIVTGPATVHMSRYGEFRGVEFLSLSAVLLGWVASSWPLRRPQG